MEGEYTGMLFGQHSSQETGKTFYENRATRQNCSCLDFCPSYSCIMHSVEMHDKQLVATFGKEVISKPPLQDLETLSPNHEQADTCIFLHADHAIEHYQVN
eukprot:GHVR01044587.1.p1 GENE.GHVR01044587.1~~GHVR01044587.1.p1  ORF type:complete len:101 (-),score=14.29 GHVR01044587.1:383-685(-)